MGPQPIEQALVRSLRWLVSALALCPLLLFADTGPDELSTVFLVHLSVLVGYGLVVTDDLAGFIDDSWFGGFGWSPQTRRLAAGAALVVLATGLVALVTLASSAAMRYDASTQFLQLLSALDIAWAGAAIMVGLRLGWGRAWSWLGGLALGVFCVWSIWRYVDVVGFDDGGGWIVSGSDLMRYVIPYDMAAAVVAVVVLVLGTRDRTAATQPTAQARP